MIRKKINLEAELAYFREKALMPIDEKIIKEKTIDETIDKLGKQQRKALCAIEDTADQVEEITKKLEHLVDNQKKELLLLEQVIEVVDLFDELYRFLSDIQEEGALKEKIQRQKAKVNTIVAKMGLTKIDIAQGYTLFDVTLHRAVQVGVSEAEKDTVLDVIKSGYLYQGKVLRKADVVVQG